MREKGVYRAKRLASDGEYAIALFGKRNGSRTLWANCLDEF